MVMWFTEPFIFLVPLPTTAAHVVLGPRALTHGVHAQLGIFDCNCLRCPGRARPAPAVTESPVTTTSELH